MFDDFVADDTLLPSSEAAQGAPAEASSPDPVIIAGLSDEALERELCGLAAHLAVAECRFVLLVGEIDRRRIWADQGARSCAHWLSWRVGVGLVAGREQVRVGRALGSLPGVKAAFGEGRLSYSKVRALTRIATPETEAVLLDMARYATAAQLDTIVRGFRRAEAGEGRTALERQRRRYLHTFTDDDGMVVLHGRFSAEDGALVRTAIEAASEALVEDRTAGAPAEAPVHGEPPAGPAEDPYAATQADGLVAICESVLAHGLSPSAEKGPIVQVLVHADEAVLADPSSEGCSYEEGSGALSVHTVQRMCCDARVATVRYRPDGTVVPEGKTREIPVTLRRAVLARDGGCRWPGCTVRRHVQVHHVTWVSRRGKTRLTNLAALCKYHHKLVHEGGYGLTMDRHARVRVTAPDGTDLSAIGPPVRPQGQDLFAQHEQAGLRLDHRTMPVGGDRLDLPLAIDVLFQARDRAREGSPRSA